MFPAWTPKGGGTNYPAGSFYFDLAPEGTPFPRLVLSCVPRSDSMSVYGAGNAMAYEPVTFRFTLYGNAGSQDALAKAEAVMGIFDGLLLTWSGGRMNNTVRRGQPAPRLDPNRDSAGNDIWGVTWVYDWTIASA